LSGEREIRLRKDGIRAFRSALSRPPKQAFWGLRDISFEVRKGEIFGIIGGNGAGKSTLLKIIAGIYPASAGAVEVRGAVAPLIELGGAVNPELSGAENIFLLGSIYRIPRREIKRRFDEIVEFSGLRRFIETPVKNYSSGMFIRLAFSTIIFFRPDIVLIDEVFSVGDEVFQQKSFDKIMSFKEQGATIVLVSHDLGLIEQMCDRALVLSRGKAAFVGAAGEAVEKYHELLRNGEALDAQEGKVERGGERASGAAGRRWGNRRVEIGRVSFVGKDGLPRAAFASGDYFEARIPFESKHEGEESPIFGAAIHTIYKMLIYGPNTLESESGAERPVPPRGVVRFVIPELPLFPGDYLFSASAYDRSLSVAYDHHDMSYSFHVEAGAGKGREFGCVKIRAAWKID
jgi:ABC-type polysaccharide/polyol phosphate transport system ATPase subunit